MSVAKSRWKILRSALIKSKSEGSDNQVSKAAIRYPSYEFVQADILKPENEETNSKHIWFKISSKDCPLIDLKVRHLKRKSDLTSINITLHFTGSYHSYEM